MRRNIILTAVIVVGLTIVFAHAQSADEDAIRKLSQDFTAAVNKGDGKGAAALFTADGDYVSSTGRKGKGAVEIERMVADQAAAAFKGLTFKSAATAVRIVRPDVAITDVTFESSTRKGHSTMVAVREEGRWRIAALRAMVPVPAK